MAAAPTVRSGAFAEASGPHCSPFSAISSVFGAANPPSGAPLCQLPSHTLGESYSTVSVLQAAQAGPQPERRSLQAALNVNSLCSVLLDPGVAHQERGGDLFSSELEETHHKNTNPFLF